MKLPKKIIATAHLEWHPYDLKQTAAFRQLLHNNSARLQEHFPALMAAAQDDVAMQLLAHRKVSDWNHDRAYTYLLIDKQTGVMAGYIHLKDIDWKKKNAELSYFTDAAFERRGYMSEVLRNFLKIAFQFLQLERVFVRVRKDNAPSIHLVEKAGMQYEGTFFQDTGSGPTEQPDMHCYGMTNADFLRKNPVSADKQQ